MHTIDVHRRHKQQNLQEREPEGFTEAVGAAALMLGIMASGALVGFEWERNAEIAAHRFAVTLVEQISRDGESALVPNWTGKGEGPGSTTARQTFGALRLLGHLVPDDAGHCDLASNFSLCTGTRFTCHIRGATPLGAVEASIGLCDSGSAGHYSFDKLDVGMPLTAADPGNRSDVIADRDGLIRYGSTPLPAEILNTRLRRHMIARPLGF